MRFPVLSALAAPLLAFAIAGGAGAASASPARFAVINGSGSSYAALALDQWARDVQPSGLTVNYNPDGSAAGRADYEANQDDFVGSDVAFLSYRDELGGVGPEHPVQGYSYIPDVAGGIAFPYHLRVAGHLIRNLRLSGRTLMEIFTGRIRNWDNPQIARDYGRQLPNLRITPVIRSDGAGTTFFFTRWMAHVFPRQWNAFCQRVRPGIKLPCPPTEFYPHFGDAKSENGSNNMVTFIASHLSNGAIGYDEFAYALNAHVPVLRLRNPAGRYVLPTAVDVTVALTKAVINENPHSKNFLQQNLDAVYTFRDPRSYPLSDYSYLIVPRLGTRQPTNFTPAKGRSLSTFIDFALCAGQRQVTALGYAPLPRNLVAGGLLQVRQIPGHVAVPTLARCLRSR
jgi:ABC-type phosphate transport system substrate-binding protein